jgi:hypothetical protein
MIIIILKYFIKQILQLYLFRFDITCVSEFKILTHHHYLFNSVIFATTVNHGVLP